MPDGRGRPGVLLDRDGVLNEEIGHVAHPERLHVIPGAGAAIAELKRAGAAVGVVTNQSGVARGFFTEEEVRAANESLSAALASDGEGPDAYFYCPHHPTEGSGAYTVECGCRKPATGLVEAAIGALGLDRSRTVLVGDQARDMECGRRAGISTVAVGAGAAALSADTHAGSLAEALPWILDRIGIGERP
jgi:D-glycero-D-manno-heptose 1,7-bisphosphate phosphatase